MKVAFFNSYLQGGAAKASIAIFNSLIKQELVDGVFYYMENLDFNPNQVDSNNPLFIQENPHGYKSIADRLVKSISAKVYYRKLNRTLKGKTQAFGIFNGPSTFYPLSYKVFEKKFQAEVVHLNWISEWLDYNAFFSSVPDNIPIVWTLHDMNPFTGGCHHAGNCEGFRSDCFPCIQIEGSRKLKFASKNLSKKKQILASKRIHIIAPSKWMLEKARNSVLFKNASFYHIPNGINTSVFFPAKTLNHSTFPNLVKGKTVILFVADNLRNRSKGYGFLLEAIEILKENKQLIFIAIGKKDGELIHNDYLVEYGRVNSSSELAEFYSMADIFVAPSIEDTFPSTIIEAMACKTPVIGFRTGGIPDPDTP